MTVLAKVLGAQVRQLILGLDVMDADLAFLHQFLYVVQCSGHGQTAPLRNGSAACW